MTDERKVDLGGRKVAVVGLGVSGYAAARVLLEEGAFVTVVDDYDNPEIRARAHALSDAGAVVETGGHHGALQAHDLAVISPGIAPNAAVVDDLRTAGTPIWSEVELAYRLSSCSFLAVTGTNGKTTTTALVASMLAEEGIPSLAGGNIGHALSAAVRDVPDEGAIAVEVSSFQLSTIERFRPSVGVILNIAEDHVDWHGSMAAYIAAKQRLFENQTDADVLVLNADDPNVMGLADRAPSRVVWFSATRQLPVGYSMGSDGILRDGRAFVARDAISLPGRPGVEDALAAAGAAAEFGVSATSIERALRAFRRGRHRMELVAMVDDVAYVDDSKATNPHACLAALEGASDVVLIAGGRAKGVDLSVLAAGVPSLRAVVALGEARAEVAAVFSGKVPVCEVSTMREAVTAARRLAIRGGSILLSPACASLDMYGSYAERGADFARCVEEIAGEGS